MSTYREVVYMILDELKNNTDDGYFEEEHIIQLMGNYRAFLLKQRYSDIRKEVPLENYQNIQLSLIEVPAIAGEACEGGTYLRSSVKIPTTMSIGVPKVYPIDFYSGELAYISRERMKYVGSFPFTRNMIYSSLGPDGYLYFKSLNPQFLQLEVVRMVAIFSDPKEAFNLQCPTPTGTIICDIMDEQFPIEPALLPPMNELILRELGSSLYKPTDEENDGKDALSKLSITKQPNNGRGVSEVQE